MQATRTRNVRLYGSHRHVNKMSETYLDLTTIDHFVCGISGGKDSTALLLWMLNEFKVDPSELICTFADTGNEADETYSHIHRISDELHPVIWLKPERDFYELAKHKKRFPSSQARFCTTELKLKPAKKFLESLDGTVLSLNGIRKDESKARSILSEFASAFETYTGYPEWRPLLEWTLEDVFLIHKKYNFPLNPLYAEGFTRVGCFPCIMSRKSEIRRLAKRHPERIDFLREQEISLPNKYGFGSFFSGGHIPERYRSLEIDGNKIGTIDDVAEWSMTPDPRKRPKLNEEDEEQVYQMGACE